MSLITVQYWSLAADGASGTDYCIHWYLPAGGGQLIPITVCYCVSCRRGAYNDLSLPGNGARGPAGWRRRGGGTAAAKFESTDSIVKYSRVYQLEIINENKYTASFQCSINLVRIVRWTVKLYIEILDNRSDDIGLIIGDIQYNR